MKIIEKGPQLTDISMSSYALDPPSAVANKVYLYDPFILVNYSSRTTLINPSISGVFTIFTLFPEEIL